MRSDRGGDYNGGRDDVRSGGREGGDEVRSQWRLQRGQGRRTSWRWRRRDEVRSRWRLQRGQGRRTIWRSRRRGRGQIAVATTTGAGTTYDLEVEKEG